MATEEPTSKRKKRKNTKPSLQPEIEDNIEMEEKEDSHSLSEDIRDSPQILTKQKKHSKRSSKNSKTNGKKHIPETFITAVLEELSDDMIDEPPRRDKGDCSVLELYPQTPTRLPSDKVYVERKNGFASTPRAKMFQSLNYQQEELRETDFRKTIASPLELAILIQKYCRPIYTLCHGLLGGIALLHIILVYGAGGYFEVELNFVKMYAYYARIHQTLFHLLSIICFISIMDRCDVKHMDLRHFIDLFQYHFSTILVIIVYLTTVILTFVTTKWDDWLALSLYNTSDNNLDVSYTLTIWKNLNLCRNIGAISGWMLVALFPAEDMLHLHLYNMIKYQPSNTLTVPTRY